MRKPFPILLALCALLVAGARAATFNLGVGSRWGVTWDSLSTGDTLNVTASYADSTTYAQGTESGDEPDSVVVLLNGFTVDFVSIGVAEYAQTFTSGTYINEYQILGPGTISSSGGGILFSPRDGEGPLRLHDVTLTNTGAATASLLAGTGTGRDNEFDVQRCEFVWASTAVASTIACNHTNSGATSYVGCDWTGGPNNCLKIGTKATADGLVLSACTMSGFDRGGLLVNVSGSVDVDDLTCQEPLSSGTYKRGIEFIPTAGVADCGASLSDVVLDGCSAVFEVAGDVAQGGGITLTNFVFRNVVSTYGLLIRANDVTVVNPTCTDIDGNATDGIRLIMVGSDGGLDVGEADRANRVSIVGGDLRPTFTATRTGGTVYLVESKSDSLAIYNLIAGCRSAINPDSTTFALINLRGATNPLLYNVTAYRDDDLQVIRYSEQAAGEFATGVQIRNLHVIGSGGDVFHPVDWYASGMSQDSLDWDVSHVLAEGGLNLLDTDDVEYDAAERDWATYMFDADTLTNEERLAYRNWAGTGPLPGITATGQGLYPIGAQGAARAASVTDPVITSSQAGFEDPYRAWRFLTSAGASGVVLRHRVRNLADLAAALYWTQGYPADSTGTWADEFKGVLEVSGAED